MDITSGFGYDAEMENATNSLIAAACAGKIKALSALRVGARPIH
jgi:hypothetical protein